MCRLTKKDNAKNELIKRSLLILPIKDKLKDAEVVWTCYDEKQSPSGRYFYGCIDLLRSWVNPAS